ncbi:monovalent cation/H+ antiporter subunit D family protein [Ferrimonas marina]|uniref:Multisubunit sodium/proton antiporter, MrpD subunit n=1 Tax=Ferrimonas marina TaxID=299255 RepID=A0A1M5N931_9GAMM|nr:monovalent cation/H+ antiporter subunit D family protein [Ferrimonas marina]SHG85523.1 multisubunit sodium/proton antiporter, MrpD subunit [Ferrimonas marina]
MLAHLPILQVIVPLMAAPACLLLRPTRLLWLFCMMACGLAFAISLLLIAQVIDSGPIVYQLGGWQAPWGIEYRIDALNAFLLVLVSGVGTLVLWAAQYSIERELPEQSQLYFYIAYLLCMAGLMGILATGDAFNVFVFLEISSLATYTLVGLGKDRRALWASYQYLIMGTIGATFILIGIGLMYMMTGTLNMHDLAQRLPEVAHTRTLFTAFAFFSVGVCLKLAVFPLHLWLPNAYAYAPSVVTAFLAATATKVALYVMLRFVFDIYGVTFSFEHLPLQKIHLMLGLAGIFAGSLIAIYQTNVKRLLAYSSVAQIGYMILGFSLASELGLVATLLHMFNHGLMKGALFLALAAVVYRIGSAELSQFKGLGQRMPLTMAAIVVGGLSLIGVPLTVGFVSKWYLVLALLEQGWWPVVVLVLLSSMLAVIYVWRIVEVAYFQPPEPGTQREEVPMGFLLPVWILVFANIYLGIDTRFTVGIAEMTAQGLFGVQG